MLKFHQSAIAFACAVISCSTGAMAVLSVNVDVNGWPNAAHRNAAVAAMQATVNRYNAYGDFGNYNVYAYYNSGIPTAQASYLGSIGYGGTYPNERVTMHEMAHYLGSGTYGTPWDGTRSRSLVHQFDGLESTLNGDGAHFWPYGLNYDSEGAEINKQRQVAMVYAQRVDMGVGNAAYPSTATAVNLIASDAVGESGFNYASTWSNTHFAQPGTNYFTGNFLLRTPASANSFTFAGESVTVNNTNGINGGLLYKGSGTTGVVSFKNLYLNGGYVRHASASGDLFRLAGKANVTGVTTVDAAQGNIEVSASVAGSGSLNKSGSFALTLSGTATYSGDTNINGGTLRLLPVDPIANYTFDSVSGITVNNTGTGGAGMNGTLTGAASIVSGGQSGNALSVSGGASVNINSGIANLSYNNSWTVSAWVKTSTPGSTILSKSDGGWGRGNSIFYLGDGSAGGSGGIPSSVRWAGGFFQATPGSTNVANNAWHQVTYVNSAGNFAIFVDGVLQSLTSGNAGFVNGDVGGLIRLGATTNTVAGDGTVNFNGLLDNVRVYGHALSAQQVLTLYQGGNAFGSLPSTTNVTIASGATLDLGGSTQQIGSLTGPGGSLISLGAGRLIVNSGNDSLYGGTIAGSGGVTKNGTGTLTLAGNLNYTGSTIIQGGTLLVTISAQAPILGASAAGADIQAGKLIFDYTVGSSPAATVLAILDAGFDQPTPFSSGRLRNTLIPSGHLLGWMDDSATSKLTVLTTIAGDLNLDLTVNFDDLLLLAQNYDAAGSGKVWGEGDTNYDGVVNFDDLLAVAQNYGLNALVSNGDAIAADQFLGDWRLALSIVPEPGTMAALSALGFAGRVRRR